MVRMSAGGRKDKGVFFCDSQRAERRFKVDGGTNQSRNEGLRDRISANLSSLHFRELSSARPCDQVLEVRVEWIKVNMRVRVDQREEIGQRRRVRIIFYLYCNAFMNLLTVNHVKADHA